MIVDADVLQATLNAALAGGGDFADVFVEDRRSGSVRRDDDRLEELVTGWDRGAGVRVVTGESAGFAHTADLSERGLHEAARAAGAAARAGGSGVRCVALGAVPTTPTHAVETWPETVPKATKIELLARADDAARAESGSIRQVSASLADSRRRVCIATSEGVLVEDDVARTRLVVQCVAEGDTGLQTALEAPGRTVGYEMFDAIDAAEVARVAARRAVVKLGARPAPTGPMPVVLRRGAGGVLFHEACGHGLEADLVARDASVFRGRVGQQVASPAVTLVDDGRYAREWGTSAIDDEGVATGRAVLIENGVLTDYMWDRIRSRAAGRAPSGNGRRQSYRHLPMVRMTNTYVLAGEEDPDEIVRSTPYGLYCVALGGGQVDTATGDFVFGITEGYMIERGRITEPVRNAQLVGNGPEVLRLVDAVGDDFDTWTGTCGKDGQSVPVSSGQPTLRVASVTVGGTAA